MKRKAFSILLVLLLALPLLTGCGGSGNAAYKDGTYTGKSSEDDKGAYGEATIIIEGNKITDCKYVTWQKDGTVKDENYGKVNGEISNQDYYDKAQRAVEAMQQYAQKLVEVQKAADVDAVSGATISYNQFKEAVNSALDEAKK
ncbi:Major membrane immunogen, membrane-anchored lipoprotein [Sporobacter termitidis DSM 10068]|uniref:Major membrane immunogen, membrane-anchored lipoprotein n=1 Tax=Sporobacter termitidis DSM 10068 TaxID=1123282 RepID=A0A1M5XTV7_9FIRM|nr:FMN-binding protein [Sporobacter termitidis]SHI03152.1 Major membrane immunogen, membrane-anchored lipoprotein [Sporobacter termitidis DSM 10068]